MSLVDGCGLKPVSSSQCRRASSLARPIKYIYFLNGHIGSKNGVKSIDNGTGIKPVIFSTKFIFRIICFRVNSLVDGCGLKPVSSSQCRRASSLARPIKYIYFLNGHIGSKNGVKSIDNGTGIKPVIFSTKFIFRIICFTDRER